MLKYKIPQIVTLTQDSYSAWKQAEIDIHIIRSLNVLE